MTTLSDSAHSKPNPKKKKSLLRHFLSWNVSASKFFDRLFLPTSMTCHGHRDFQERVVPRYANQTDITIYDLGGGSRPYISQNHKSNHNQTIIGIDIDEQELKAAPQGSYDKIIAEDLSQYRGQEDADLIICQSTLEHVHDNIGAFHAIASTLKSGGHACIFTPSRHAVFARLNMILSEKIKQKILFSLHPHKARGHDGFKAYYDHCTPKEFRALAAENGLEIVALTPYYKSTYFEICFPIYVLWRLWILGFKVINGENAAETFSIILRKT